MKKLFLLLLVILSWSSSAQGIPPPIGPGSENCTTYPQIDTNNDGFVAFELNNWIAYVRNYAWFYQYDLSGYTLQFFPTANDFTNNTNPITSPTYTNTVINTLKLYLKLTYTGSGPQYNQSELQYRFYCYTFVALPYNGDFDNDSVPNGLEDLNHNGNPLDDNTYWAFLSYYTDPANYNDPDDDGDGILTINEDYNGNGNLFDDDGNADGIPDYLDFYVRGHLLLNLRVFIEGYYIGSAFMRPVKFNQDGVSSLTDVEDITIELHSITPPYALVTSTTAMLKTDGFAYCIFPAVRIGNYYVVVKAKNCIAAWSSAHVYIGVLPNQMAAWGFGNSLSNAYGNNLKYLDPSLYGLYSGDVNQDGMIDATDYSLWEYDTNNFATGNLPTDFNGDGLVDPTDYSIWETNNNNFITVIKPE